MDSHEVKGELLGLQEQADAEYAADWRRWRRAQYPENTAHDKGCERHLRELLRFTLEGWTAHERRTAVTADNPAADKYAKRDAADARRVAEHLRNAARRARVL